MKIVNSRATPYLIQISILSSSSRGKQPEYTVEYNNCVFDPASVTQISATQEQHNYTIKATDLNSVAITLVNKQGDDTVVVDDKIVEDLYIQVQSFKVDDFDLTNKLDSISSYSNDQGIKRTFGFMSINGTLTLNTHNNLLYTNLVTSIIGK